MSNTIRNTDLSGEIALSTLILIGSAVIAIVAAGITAYQSYQATGQIDWENTITTGISWFMMAYTLGMSAYVIYLSYCNYKGIKPITEVNFNAHSSAGIPVGRWQTVNESMSPESFAYQSQITGHPGEAYVVNGVKFDGISNTGRLIEVKGDYSHFINKSGMFYEWFTGANSLVSKALRQLSAAGGTPIDWYFSNLKTMNAIQALFEENGITGINFIYQAMK